MYVPVLAIFFMLGYFIPFSLLQTTIMKELAFKTNYHFLYLLEQVGIYECSEMRSGNSVNHAELLEAGR